MIDILMATYNGGRYIRNQILSLQQQTYEDWRLLVRDDGSSDNTLEIVKSFMDNDPRVILIKDDLGNLGAGKCFLELTKYAQADYVMFCDQDDIWFEKKVEILLNAAVGRMSRNKPFLAYCNGFVYSDYTGTVISNSIPLVRAKGFRELLFCNAGYHGCVMLFNKKLCGMLANYKADYFYMHDDVTTLLAHSFGDVLFIEESLLLYRQHSKNVTGNIQFGFVSFLRRLFNSNPVVTLKHYEEKKYFYLAYRDELNHCDVELFEQYLKFPHKNLLGRIYILCRYGFSESGSFLKLLFKTLMKKPIS